MSIALIELHAISPRRLVLCHFEIISREAKGFENAVPQLGSLSRKHVSDYLKVGIFRVKSRSGKQGE